MRKFTTISDDCHVLKTIATSAYDNFLNNQREISVLTDLIAKHPVDSFQILNKHLNTQGIQLSLDVYPTKNKKP
jgi:hypothetical protein